MELLTLIIAICFVQVWGRQNPLHRDGWFYRWVAFAYPKIKNISGNSAEENSISLSSSEHTELEESRLDESFKEQSDDFSSGAGKGDQDDYSLLATLIVVGGPVLIAGLIAWTLYEFSYWLLLPYSVCIVLYSFGRGEFTETVGEYVKASYVEDWACAVEKAEALGLSCDSILSEDWSTLHRRVFSQAAYSGFERSFAVVFWFLLFGPLFALFYRLLYLYLKSRPNDAVAEHILWAVEWPAVRLLGLTFALTGNFVGCFGVLKNAFFDFTETAKHHLTYFALGSFSSDDTLDIAQDINRKEVSLLTKLYQRTMWFWLVAIAVIELFL